MSRVPRILTADRGDAGRRIDLMLRRHLTDVDTASRTHVQAWIADGQVAINGTPVRRVSTRVALGDSISVAIPAHDENQALGGMVAEDVRLDVIYEDDYLIALDKPAGLFVHPGYKNTTGKVMNAL